MEKKKWKQFLKRLRLLNPKYLEKEVSVYGYTFSWKAHMLVVLCSLLGISAIGILYKLEAVYFSITILAVLLMLPVVILLMYKRMYEQKKFADVATYAEQILYSFQKEKKIISSLKECREVFEDGKMRDAMDDAIEYLEEGKAKTEQGILREALDFIEKPYGCVKLHMVHELLINSEEHGGEDEGSILLLLNDLELWKRRGYFLQTEKKKSHADNIISIAIATILCAIALYVLDGMGDLYPTGKTENIFKAGSIQFSSFVFILFCLYTLMKSFKSLTVNWLQGDLMQDEKYVLDSYVLVMNYEDAKEKRKSLLFSAPFIIAAVVAFYLKKVWFGVICIVIAVIMLCQHKIGYNLAKKTIDKELYAALPQWLMEIALLLQTNNVQVSITKSAAQAPAVLMPELKLLMERLKKAPDKLSSYLDFCKQFDVPEIQSCMKMLHAISESGTGNASVQIGNLIQRVNEMQNIADNARNENIALQAKLIFSYPVMAATIKMLADLTVGMVYMMQMLGNIGGMV